MNESEAREILGDIEQLKRDIYRTQYVEDVRELAIMLIDFCNNYLMEKVPPPCEKNWYEVVRLGKATIYAAIASKRSTYPVRASGFYAWSTRKPRQTTDARDRLAVAVAHEKTRRVYGAVRLYHELRAKGFSMSLWKVKNFGGSLGLWHPSHGDGS